MKTSLPEKTSIKFLAAAVVAVLGLGIFPVTAAIFGVPWALAEEGDSASVTADGNDSVLTADSDLIRQIQKMNSDVKQKRESLTDLNSKIEQYKKLVMDKKLEQQSLGDQISLIDNRISRQQLAIDIAQDEIKAIELEVRVLDGQISDQEQRMEREKKLLGALARKLYRQGFDRSLWEIMLAHRTLNEFFESLHSVSRLQLAVDDSIGRVKDIKDSLATEKEAREAKLDDGRDRKRQLEVAKLQLEDERSLKTGILDQSKASEMQYRYLLADLKNEQAEADSEIKYLEKALRQKVQLADRLGAGGTALSWPVVPSRGISAYFHDRDYPFRYVFEHPAIDIRAYQGTPIRAAAAGVVARAKDAGMGYSYIMLLHNDSISTVYGHASKIVAKEDSFVERGEIIGYSGGMPGTPGAGKLTTGPHLHFEVRKDGIPVDPMSYLPAP